MTSANAFLRLGIFAPLFAGLIALSSDVSAQSTAATNVETTESEEDTDRIIDRGKLRLKLLISLVENELQEATLRQSRLTTEASALDQARRALQDGPSKGTQAEKKQIDVIEQRLQQIDKEVATRNSPNSTRV